MDSIAAAISLLKRRHYHTKQLSQKLADKGFVPDEVEKALLYLKKNFLIDDALFIETQVSLLLQKGYSNQHILTKLRTKNIPVDLQTIEFIAHEHSISPDNQLEMLISNFTNRHGSIANLRDLARLNRILHSHGHSPDLIEEKIAPYTENV